MEPDVILEGCIKTISISKGVATPLYGSRDPLEGESRPPYERTSLTAGAHMEPDVIREDFVKAMYLSLRASQPLVGKS